MTHGELAKLVEKASCRLIGWADAGNDGHRLTLSVLIHAFNNSESSLLCEPSLIRSSKRPPDIVLIDPEVGVHVVEVKGISLEMIKSVDAGGLMRIQYESNVREVKPIKQASDAMFDIKNATEKFFGERIRVPFEYWVFFPFITRDAWIARFKIDGFRPDKFLFKEDLDPNHLARLFGAADRLTSLKPIDLCPLDQMDCVWRAFGDTSVLFKADGERSPRRTREGTLGEQFDEAADAYKNLSGDQQRLSEMNWEGGPRLIRGVAGSGKSVVLANNLARRVHRLRTANEGALFGPASPAPQLLAVCFNRTLVPSLSQKIKAAYLQRTGEPLPEGAVQIRYFNSLVYHLHQAGVWRYQRFKDQPDDMLRIRQYFAELESFKRNNPERFDALAYDAIYVDEGQDFLEEEFGILRELCRVDSAGEPNLYVFYDDAQNLYGRGRPNWQSLGINVRGGRAHVMTECFRNTRPIVETAFNVLYGTLATTGEVPKREYGDIRSLEEKGLIMHQAGIWRVNFAGRDGTEPKLAVARSDADEVRAVIDRLRWLLGEQQVRPEDILVLAARNERVLLLAGLAERANLPGVNGIHVPLDDDKDQPLAQAGKLTFSTVASAKGYDAYCVLLASANEFEPDVRGRASFYVGCTRAIEYLEVFAYAKIDLVREFEKVLEVRGVKPVSL